MNFIELLFGFAPDGGNGSTEFAVLTFLVVLVFFVFRKRRTLKNASDSAA